MEKRNLLSLSLCILGKIDVQFRYFKHRMLLTSRTSWVQTELGIGGGQLMNADTQPPVTIEASVSGIVKVIDTATKQSHGGRFWIYDGSERSW